MERSADPSEILGKTAVDCMPCIMQAFIERPKRIEKGLPFDRRLYVVRRVFEQSSDDTYVVSLSSRTIVYKGMFLVGQLRLFFKDLQDEDYESAIAMVHSRFSTNTAPSWQRAIRTALSCITARSIRSAEMRTRCVPARRRWSQDALRESCTRCFRRSILQDLTRPCWIMLWNSW